MGNKKVLAKILAGTKNVRFNEFDNLIKGFGFELARINGSHHIYNRHDIPELINIQNRKGQVSPYQIKQFLAIIEKYNLSLEDEELFLNYEFSKHAIQQLKSYGRNQIKLEWIEETLKNPDKTIVLNSENISSAETCCWKCISEYGNRALKVVYNQIKDPPLIITVYFDRGYKK